MTKYGAVIVFKEGVTEEEAYALLSGITGSGKVETPSFTYRDTGERKPLPWGANGETIMKKVAAYTELGPDDPRDPSYGDRIHAMLHSFESDHGGPVWYIP